MVERMEGAQVGRGMTVAELARRIGSDRRRLWRVLDGQREMRVEEFLCLCVALGLSPQGFVTRAMAEEVLAVPRRRGV